MKKSLAKKRVLLTGFIGSTLLILLVAGQTELGLNCEIRVSERISSIDMNGNLKSYLEWHSVDWCVPTAFMLLPFLSLLLFSLITYFVREEYFRSWWNFAKWMMPIIFVATFILGLIPPDRGGFFNMDGILYIFILLPLYVIFLVVFLGMMIWEYLKRHTISFKW